MVPLCGQVILPDKHVSKVSQQVEPVGVLGQAAEADLGVTELRPDVAKRMLYLRPNTDFDPFRTRRLLPSGTPQVTPGRRAMDQSRFRY